MGVDQDDPGADVCTANVDREHGVPGLDVQGI